jgi:hypothetical protein
MVACYPLNNNANDMSGNNYNGTTNNLTSVADRFGNPNSAYHFSGSSSYITLPTTGFLLDTFTYSAWCRPTTIPSTGNYYSVLSIGGSVADQAILLGNDAISANIGFGAASWGANVTPHDCNQNSLPVANQWYHVVMTRTNSTVNMYFNDSLVCTGSAGNVDAGYLNTVTALIGSRTGTSGQNFVGDIDDVRIFNCALSQTQIKNLGSSCFATGTDDLFENSNSLTIYPNPLTNSSVLQLNFEAKNAEMVIYNMLGQDIWKEKFTGKTLVLKKEVLKNGVYFVSVRENGKQYIQKLIVQ